MTDAIKRNCDVFITGEARFHDCLLARDSGLGLLLPGHYATERLGMENLAIELGLEFPNIEVWASRREADPIDFV